MVKNVNHKECICDLCGARTYISQDKFLPEGWETVGLKLKRYDFCEQCFIRVDEAIEDLKAKEKETTLSIERDTECDLCDHRYECESKGYIVETTRPHHNTRHFIRGLGSNCMKRRVKMVTLTKSLRHWLFVNHPDKLALITLGHVELFTEEMEKEYLEWCKTEEGLSYLEGERA